MCQQQRLGLAFRSLEKCGAVEIEKLTNEVLGDDDLVIDPVDSEY